MKKFLIDSDIVIWFLKGREREEKLLRELTTAGDLCISVVTLTEVRAGLQKNPQRVISQLKEVFKTVSLDAKMAEIAGSFKQKYNLEIADMFIAATSVVSNATLVTYNKRHFPMADVKLHNF